MARLATALRQLQINVEIVRLDVGRGAARYWRSRSQVREHIRRFRPDIVHVHFGYGILAVPAMRRPLITTFNGDDLNGTPTSGGGLTFKSRLGILVSQLAAWRSDRNIVVSEAMRERVWLRAARERTVVIRDAVDSTLFRPIPKVEARRHLRIDEDRRLVLFPHDVTQANKRHSLAAAAVAELKKTIRSAELWTVNGVAPDDMPWYYAAADVMIVTSMREGGPTSVKEALACGLPIVSVEVGDTRLFDEAQGYMRRSTPTPTGLAEALRTLLQEHASPGRSLLPPELELGASALRTVALYEELIEPGKSSGSPRSE